MHADSRVEQLATEARGIVGSAAVWRGSEKDAVDGIVPKLIVEPSDTQTLAEILVWASERQQSVLVRGGGTKITWGPVPSKLDLVLSTRHLNAVLNHRHGDLTVTVEAGATLTTVNDRLSQHGQWIPLDPFSDNEATIGGIVATNDAGPRRHRHGSPRDLIIGVTLARVDGRCTKAGGTVVKNVAGYDLSRLLTGSFGSLAVILSASFKLAPQPHSSRTVVVKTSSLNELGKIAMALRASQLTPTALESQFPECLLFVRFETIVEAATNQAERTVKLAKDLGGQSTILSGEPEETLWRAHSARPWEESGLVFKVSTPPADVTNTLEWISGAAEKHRVGWEAVGRAGLGIQIVRFDGNLATQADLITSLRSHLKSPERGSVVLLRGQPELKHRIDTWGPLGTVVETMRAVKQQFDPMGILNPGRGPGNI